MAQGALKKAENKRDEMVPFDKFLETPRSDAQIQSSFLRNASWSDVKQCKWLVAKCEAKLAAVRRERDPDTDDEYVKAKKKLEDFKDGRPKLEEEKERRLHEQYSSGSKA